MLIIHLNWKNSPVVSTVAQGGPEPLPWAQNTRILRHSHSAQAWPLVLWVLMSSCLGWTENQAGSSAKGWPCERSAPTTNATIQCLLIWSSAACYGIIPLYAVTMFYYHWLIKKLLRPIASQDRTRWEIQAEIQGEGDRARKMPTRHWSSKTC